MASSTAAIAAAVTAAYQASSTSSKSSQPSPSSSKPEPSPELKTISALFANPQSECALFNLPGEIRSQIWEYVLLAYEDHSAAYRDDHTYYRPGFHYHSRINLSLLKTCKRIYSEAALLPIKVNTHVFWYIRGPVEYTRSGNPHWEYWYRKLSQRQRDAVESMHLFVQQSYLELLGSHAFYSDFKFHTKRLQLTFRYSDWWTWEAPEGSNDMLGICPWLPDRTSFRQMEAEPLRPDLSYISERMQKGTWGWQICQVGRLEILEMEFEVDVVKKSQLDAVVERAKHWKFPIARESTIREIAEEKNTSNGTTEPKSQAREEGNVLEWDGTLIETSWQGKRDLKYWTMPRLSRTRARTDAPMRTYHVVTMVWRNARGTD